MSAIATSLFGLAIFGKTISERQAMLIAQKAKRVVLALDPDTYFARTDASETDTARAIARFAKYGIEAIPIRWPDEMLAAARTKVEFQLNRQQKQSAGAEQDDSATLAPTSPDAADLGLREMRRLINAVLPTST